MIIPDVNLLLYAHIEGMPEHRSALAWWQGLLNREETVGIALPALFGFIRIATHPRIFDLPMSVDAAVDATEQWLGRRNVRLLVPGRQHLDIAFGLLRQVGAAANLTTDAQLAALAIEHQAELHSSDTDFGRFRGLRWINPLA